MQASPKKLACVLLALILCLGLLPAAGLAEEEEPPALDGDIHVTGIEPDETEIHIKVGETIRPTATVTPENADNKLYYWQVKDTSIAYASLYGDEITGKAPGTTELTLTAWDGFLESPTKVKLVVEDVVHVTGVSLGSSAERVEVGDTVTLKAAVDPKDADNRAVRWSSSDSTVAAVDDKGVVTGVKAGKATITVETEDGGFTDSCEVEVRSEAWDLWIDGVQVTSENRRDILATGVFSFDSDSLTLTVRGDYKGKFSTTAVIVNNVRGVTIDVQADAKLTSEKNVPILLVTENTTLTGSGVLTLETAGSPAVMLDDRCVLTVQDAELTASSKTVVISGGDDGEKLDIRNSVVRASSSGFEAMSGLTGGIALTDCHIVKPAGAAVRDGAVYDGEAMAKTVEIEPVVHVTGVWLDEIPNLTVGDTHQATWTVSPAEATDKSVTFKSSNESIATVSETGLITVLAEGSVTITLASKDSGVTDEKGFSAVPPAIHAESVRLTKTSAVLEVGSTLSLEPEVVPTGIADTTYTCASDNPSVASVDEYGLVSANKPGKATITVTANDNGVFAACEVTVAEKGSIVPVSSITFIPPEVGLTVGETRTLVPVVDPEDSTTKAFRWRSDNEAVATVKDGVVTAVAEGTANIIATAVDTMETEGWCRVVVKKAEAPVGHAVTGRALAWNGTEDLVFLLYQDSTDDAAIRAQWQDGSYAGSKAVWYTGKATKTETADVDGKTMYAHGFSFAGVADGSYKLAIFKAGKYVPKIISVKVSGGDTALGDLKLWLYGDADYSGELSSVDVLQINRHMAGLGSVFKTGTDQDKADREAAANVTAVSAGDTELSSVDVLQINRQMAGLSSVFTTMK